jgi:transcriptional regulator with XRE-family HTH domain
LALHLTLTCYIIVSMAEGDPYEEADKRVGSNVRRLREAAGITQVELAQAMTERGWQWHQSTVARVESGRQSVRFAEAEDLVQILGTTLERLTRAASEGPEVAAIEESSRRLRRTFERMANAVRDHALEMDNARQTLASHRHSSYRRVEVANAELDATIQDLGVERAHDEGLYRYEEKRRKDKGQDTLDLL